MTQDRSGKDRIGKDSVSEDNDLPCGSHTHEVAKPYGEFQNVLLTDDELSKLPSDVAGYGDYIEDFLIVHEAHGKALQESLRNDKVIQGG